MKNRKIYISGPMTGIPNKNYDAFKDMHIKTHNHFTAKKIDFEIVNPAILPIGVANPTWKDYMKNDVKALMDCDSIVMMEGWADSEGAKIEYGLAKEFGLKIYDKDFKDISDKEIVFYNKPIVNLPYIPFDQKADNFKKDYVGDSFQRDDSDKLIKNKDIEKIEEQMKEPNNFKSYEEGLADAIKKDAII